jgi:hypothetical protein
VPQPSGDLIERLLASGLVSSAQFRECLASLPTEAEERQVIERLLRAGLLTKWQLGQLQAGRSKGFLLGGYKLMRLLGAGGMGQVYEAIDTRLSGRHVALKLLPPRIATPEAISRFRREAMAALTLQHDHIVRCFELGEENRIHYLVMEFVRGRTLADAIDRADTLAPHEAAHIGYQVALALEHAWAHGIVHRDIKPSNILLTSEGEAKLADLGLAKFFGDEGDPQASRVTQTGTLMGTLDYLAPEQALDAKQADIRADIYSLGCTLYHCLAGRPPFALGTQVQKILAHREQTAESLAALNAAVPSALADLIERRLMAKRPEDRPQSPTELVAALAPWREEGAVAASLQAENGPGVGGGAAPPMPAASSPATAVARLPRTPAQSPADQETVAYGSPGATLSGVPAVASTAGPSPHAWSTRMVVRARRLSVRQWSALLAASLLAIGATAAGIAWWPDDDTHVSAAAPADGDVRPADGETPPTPPLEDDSSDAPAERETANAPAEDSSSVPENTEPAEETPLEASESDDQPPSIEPPAVNGECDVPAALEDPTYEGVQASAWIARLLDPATEAEAEQALVALAADNPSIVNQLLDAMRAELAAAPSLSYCAPVGDPLQDFFSSRAEILERIREESEQSGSDILGIGTMPEPPYFLSQVFATLEADGQPYVRSTASQFLVDPGGPRAAQQRASQRLFLLRLDEGYWTSDLPGASAPESTDALCALLGAIVRIKEPAVPRLSEAVQADADSAACGCLALSLLGSDGEEALSTLAAHTSPRIRYCAIWALGRIAIEVRGDERGAVVRPVGEPRRAATAAPVLAHCCTDPDRKVRYAAAYVLTAVDAQEAARHAVPVVVEMIEHEDPAIWLRACILIRNFGPSAAPAVDALTRLLANNHALWTGEMPFEVGPWREHTSYFMYDLGGLGVVGAPAFVEFLSTPHRMRAVGVLASYGASTPPEAIDALIGLMAEPQEQQVVIKALRRIGGPARAAVSALRKIVDDPATSDETRFLAEKAIAEIESADASR